jgi:hypothetical protein
MERSATIPLQRLAPFIAACALWAASSSVPALAQGDPSGKYGSLALGASVEGTLAGVVDDEVVVYHSYAVPVPAGVERVTVQVEGFGLDLDLAIKVGGPIVDYDDVDHLDVSEAPDPSHTLTVAAPDTLHVDVLNLWPDPAPYRLTVQAAGATTTAPPPATANPLAPPASGHAADADPFVGLFEGDGLRFQVESRGDGYAGEIGLGDRVYPFRATREGARLSGAFVADGSEFPFTADLAGSTLSLTSGGATYRTLRQTPATAAPSNPLAGGGGMAGGGGGAADAPVTPGPILARGEHADLSEDDALAFVEALEFALAQAGYTQPTTPAEREQMLAALARNFATLPPSDQVVLAQAREVWTRVQANWAGASPADREQFVLGVFVLAFGEEAVQRAVGAGGGGGGGAGAGCDDIDACMSRYAPDAVSDTMNTQSCWAAAGCTDYDPGLNQFSYDTYDGN